MKKQFELTLMALLTAFSGMAFAAQGSGVDSVENSNSTAFLTDSEMKDVTGAYTMEDRYNTLSGRVETFYISNKGKEVAVCGVDKTIYSRCHKAAETLAKAQDVRESVIRCGTMPLTRPPYPPHPIFSTNPAK